MKKIYTFLLATAISTSQFAQVALPVTLNFTTDATAAWSDGIAQDGEGGSSKISGLDIQIFAANSSFAVLPGSTMIWHDNNYFSSGDGTFNGITPGPDMPVTTNGVPAMVIRSTSTAKNFSLASIQVYDWGGSFWTMNTYDNGILVGSINIGFNQTTWSPKTISQANELIPSFFQNIDEIRIIPNGATVIWPSINKLRFESPLTTLPVNLQNFNGQFQKNNQALLQWTTTAEQQNESFIVERSLDGKLFEAVSTIKGNGTSSNSRTYFYTDKNLPLSNTILYYRLKQVDANGRFTLSGIIALSPQSAAEKISVFPNPAINTIRVNTAAIERNVTVKIYDMTGRQVSANKHAIFSSNTDINISRLLPGSYQLLMINSNGESNSFSFTKQ